MAKKLRKIKPDKWQICTEGVTEQNYLNAYLKALNLQGRVTINCGGQKNCGCGRKHESLLDKFQRCYPQKFQGSKERWLLHDLDDGCKDKEECASFNRTFWRAWDESDTKVIYFNPCFEYWLILHEQNYQVDSDQQECQSTFQRIYEKKCKACGRTLDEKSDYKTDPTLFELLGGLDGAKCAAARAKAQLPNPPKFGDKSFICAKTCPGTNIFLLLEELHCLSSEG